MEKYKLNNEINVKIINENLFCIYGNKHSSNYFIETNELLKIISAEKYGDEYFIEKATLSYKFQQEKTYTFFRDDKKEDLLIKYNWCQRPCSSNMSLCRFVLNGEIGGHMSESLAEHYGLIQVDLNEFIHKFVKPLVKENIRLKDIIENKVHYIKCSECGCEVRTKRSDTKFCKKCSSKQWYKNLSEDKRNERRKKAKIGMRKIRKERKIAENVGE